MLAEARQVRAGQSKGSIAKAIIAYNLSVSAEILRRPESSVNGEVKDEILSAFRKCLTSYMEKNGTGHKGYDSYVAIICEYLAMVAEKPLHPPEIRQKENQPPRDTADRRYCAFRTRHLKDPFSLCRFCHCLAWPETSR